MRDRAFSLLELLVAVAILVVLVSVAVPVYTAYGLRAHRVNAQADLLRCAQGLERHATETMGYAMALDTDGDGVGDASTGPVSANLCVVAAGAYVVSVRAASPTDYVLRATPREGGAAATEGVLELDGTGARRWDRNADGDFDDADERRWTD